MPNSISDYITSICSKEKDVIHKKIEDSYDEFSVMIDGSPMGKNVETILIRLVNKKMKRQVKI